MRLLLTSLILSLLSGCHFISPDISSDASSDISAEISPETNYEITQNVIKPELIEQEGFSHYYLRLKDLSSDELTEEINFQRQRVLDGHSAAEFNLIFLYSLPNSPIHNAYTAKSILNEQGSILFYNLEDQAFVAILKDQLNQQLLLMENLTIQEHAQEKIENQKSRIIFLEQESDQLKQQIIQLQKIESAISERGRQSE